MVLAGSCGRRFAGTGDYLAYAFVVENRWSARGTNKHADTAADDQGLGMIHDDAVPAHQLDDVWPKRRAVLKCADRCLEMLGGHYVILPLLGCRRITQIRYLAFTATPHSGQRSGLARRS